MVTYITKSSVCRLFEKWNINMSQLNNRLSSDERRKAILAVASELFFELGYAATSIDAIIDKVGGSKRSIYTEFGNKEGLFKALVNDCASEMMAAMSIPASEEQKLEPLMRQLGLRLLELYSRPQMLVMYRTALQESQRFPELGQLFFEQGPKRAVQQLAQLLEAAAKRGELREIDCHLAAEHFVGTLRDNLYFKVALGLRQPLTGSEREVLVTSIVDIFLGGILKH